MVLMTQPWTLRVRGADFQLGEWVRYSSATLVENCYQPHVLTVSGRKEWLTSLVPGQGAVLVDDQGRQRFSGIVTDSDRGSTTTTVTLTSDLVRIWDRIVWPVHTAPWTTAGQNASYDVQTGPAETRLLTYVARNAGSIAYNAGGVDRRVPRLRLPTSSGRGPSAKTSGRFDNLGQLAATLAESADLRVDVVQVYEGTTPWLDLKLIDLPDLTAFARFGTSRDAGPAMLGSEWRYKLAVPTSTAVLGAATGDMEDRYLQAGAPDTDAQSLWGRRIESFIDISSGDDPSEVGAALAAAQAERTGATEVSAPIVSTGALQVGTDIPLGAKVAAVLDGEAVVDRIRQITTTVAFTSGEATVTVRPTIASSDGSLVPPTQRRLVEALRRISALERNQ